MAVTLKTEEEQAQATPWTPVSASMNAAPAAVEAVTTTSESPVAVSARRYDQATIERALALAAAMQEEHQATLTAEQVVRLGEEMNVDPAFVLKALSRLNAEEQATAQTVQEVERQFAPPMETSVGFRRLPFTDRCAAVLIPTAVSLLAYFTFRETTFNNEETFNNWYAPLFLFVAAPLLATFLGARLRSKRLGFASGALLGLLLNVAIWLALTDHSTYDDFSRFLIWTLILSAAGAVLGGLTAVLALHGARMYRRSVAALARYFPGLTGVESERQ